MGHAVTLGMCVYWQRDTWPSCLLNLLEHSLPCWDAWESGHLEERDASFLLQDLHLPPISLELPPCCLPAPWPSALADTAGEERVTCRPTCFCFLCLDLVGFQQLCCLHKAHHCSPLQCGGEVSPEKQMPRALPGWLPMAKRRPMSLWMALHTLPRDVLTTASKCGPEHCQQAPLGVS